MWGIGVVAHPLNTSGPSPRAGQQLPQGQRVAAGSAQRGTAQSSAAGCGADAPRLILGRVLGVPEDAVGRPEPGAEGPPAPRGPQHGGGTQAGLPGGHHARQAGRQRQPPLPSSALPSVPSLPGATRCSQGVGAAATPSRASGGFWGAAGRTQSVHIPASPGGEAAPPGRVWGGWAHPWWSLWVPE